MYTRLPIQFNDRLYNTLARQAIDNYPNECCGIVYQQDSVQHIQQVQNTSPNPKISYSMNMQEIQGKDIKMIYHSHPDQLPIFSLSDQQQALHPHTLTEKYEGMTHIVIQITAASTQPVVYTIRMLVYQFRQFYPYTGSGIYIPVYQLLP